MSTFISRMLTLTVLSIIAITLWNLNQRIQVNAPLMTSSFVAGTSLAIFYRIINPFGWVLVIRSMGQKVNATMATKIWLLFESRRWLPGGIWGYTSRAVAAGEIGLTKSVASASMAGELLITVIAAAILGLLGVYVHFAELYSTACQLLDQSGLTSTYVPWITMAIAAVFILIYILSKDVRNRISRVLFKLDLLPGNRFESKWMGISLAYFVLMACVNGTVNAVLLPAIDTGSVPLVAMIAATSTAWIIGLFAVFSPGGILVREAALATLLLPWIPWETGFTLAIVSRCAQLAAEIVGMALASRVTSDVNASVVGSE